MDEPLVVDVWADVSCPWCLIGHVRLQKALADEPPGSVVVRPRAFLLEPGLPPEGVPAREHYRRKFGDALEGAFARTTAEAAREGLRLDLGAMPKAPNTRLAHRAVALAVDPLAALRALFSAHFEHGRDVTDVGVVAEATGVDADALRAGAGEDAVAADLDETVRLGITAVPLFVAGGRVALSGAHEPALLRKLLAAGREQAAAA
jgi:predicted DsbA family dithiol-disulfide isomerase